MLIQGKSKKEICEILRNHNISPTTQRVEMAHLLLKKPQHLSAEEVYTLVNREFAKASKATIYNNLNLFVKVGLLSEINISPGMRLYDSNTAHHFHFLDRENGRLIDIEAVGVESERILSQASAALEKELGKKFCVDCLQIVFMGKKNSDLDCADETAAEA